MRILLLNDYLSAVGGAEILIDGLRRGLIARGHDVRLVTSRAGLGEGDPAPDAVAYGSLGAIRTPLQVANPSAHSVVKSVVREFRPDVAHVGMFLTQLSPLALDALRDVPTVCHAQWYRTVCPLGTKRLPNGSACTEAWGVACHRNGCLSSPAWAALMVQRTLLRRRTNIFDVFVIPSESMRGRLEEAGLGPISVVRNAVFDAPAHPNPANASDSPDDPADEARTLTIGFAGRLVPEKGVRTLIEAFAHVTARLPETRLLLIGDGSERGAIEGRVADLGLADRVEVTGWVERETVERRLAEATVQVIPSVWAEPFGLAAAEALTRGTPAIASGVGGLSEVIEDGVSGLLVPPGDHLALGEALERVLLDAGLRDRLTEAGRARAARLFDSDCFVDSMVDVYDRVRAA